MHTLPIRPLKEGRKVQLSKVNDTWRAIGAEGRGLYFFAEFKDTGDFPQGVVPSQLERRELSGQRVIDDRTYTVTAYGGAVDINPRSGHRQRSN